MNTQHGSKEYIAPEILPKLEILLADKLSTERSRRDARGAKFVMLFPDRSSLSKVIHSPMHPRSCIPARHTINHDKQRWHFWKLKKWYMNSILPRPLSLRNSIDSKSNSPVRDLSSTAVIFSQSASERIRGTRLQHSKAHSLFYS